MANFMAAMIIAHIYLAIFVLADNNASRILALSFWAAWTTLSILSFFYG